nr:hypothetical protein [Candidatus Sigynarchaeota archaeon]
MRIRRLKDLKKQKIGLAVVILVPVVLFGSIFGISGTIFAEIPSFGMDESKMPDIVSFQPANYTDLAAMAEFYGQRFEQFHMPLNYSVPTYFTNTSLTNVSRYQFTDNGALYSATAIVGFVGKYLTAKRENNTIMEQDALRVIKKLVSGMSMMLAVPNGGLGPEHGAILARMWASPENASIPGMPLFNLSYPGPRSPYAYFNGSGIYSNWRYSDFTSLDEYGGYYMGVAITYKYVDDPWVQSTLSLVIDQLCNGMIKSNFLGIGGFGGTTGVDQKVRFFQGGSWILLLLKMGAMAHPGKYARLYHHYAVEEGYALFTQEGGAQEIIANYYAYNFGIDVVFGLLMLEEDPALRGQYLRNFETGLWSYVKTHRNAHFNAINLIVHQYRPGDDYVRDIEDQLTRFKINHYPDIAAPLISPTAEYHLVDFSRWQAFFQYNPVGNFLAPFFFELELDRGFYDRPLTVEMCQTKSYIWGGNPFAVQGTYTNSTYEQMGLSFLTPYWLMRGFGLMNGTGVRVV